MLHVFLLLGIALLAGFAGSKYLEKFKSPHVVGFILVGVILGVSGFKLFSAELIDKLELISFLALSLIGFDVGGEMTISVFRKLGKSIFWITILEAVGAFIFVTLAVFLYTREMYIALIFGGLACATAPAATVDVLREYKASGTLTSTLFAVVAIDDGIAIILYAVGSAFAKVLIGNGTLTLINVLERPIIEMAGSLLLGAVLGLGLHKATKNIHDKNELLVLSLGFILVCSGIATLMHFSLILANMALGIVAVNLSGDRRIFDAVSAISPPVYLLFFVLVGARLQVALLPKLGVLGMLYIIFRSAGKFIGAFLGARISSAEEKVARYIGFCLFSQAGVAIGLSIQAWHEFQALGSAGYQLGLLAINTIAATTFVFQLVGPPFTRYAIIKAGEARVIKSEVQEK